MKLYRIEQGYDVHWTGTQADAKALLKELNASFDVPEAVCEVVDVPTSKAELIDWLNENAADAGLINRGDDADDDQDADDDDDDGSSLL